MRHEKFICRLPDKDKKIFDSVAKLKAAIAESEEIREKSELFLLLVCNPRQKATAINVDTNRAQKSDQILDTSSLVPGCSVDHFTSSKTTSQQQGFVHSCHKDNEEALQVDHKVNKCLASSSRATVPSSPKASERLPQHQVSGQLEDNPISSSLFIDKLQRATAADQKKIRDEDQPEENKRTENLTGLHSGHRRSLITWKC